MYIKAQTVHSVCKIKVNSCPIIKYKTPPPESGHEIKKSTYTRRSLMCGFFFFCISLLDEATCTCIPSLVALGHMVRDKKNLKFSF